MAQSMLKAMKRTPTTFYSLQSSSRAFCSHTTPIPPHTTRSSKQPKPLPTTPTPPTTTITATPTPSKPKVEIIKKKPVEKTSTTTTTTTTTTTPTTLPKERARDKVITEREYEEMMIDWSFGKYFLSDFGFRANLVGPTGQLELIRQTAHQKVVVCLPAMKSTTHSPHMTVNPTPALTNKVSPLIDALLTQSTNKNSPKVRIHIEPNNLLHIINNLSNQISKNIGNNNNNNNILINNNGGNNTNQATNSNNKKTRETSHHFDVFISLSNEKGDTMSRMHIVCSVLPKNNLGIKSIRMKHFSDNEAEQQHQVIKFSWFSPQLQDKVLDYLDELRVNSLLVKFVKDFSDKLSYLPA